MAANKVRPLTEFIPQIIRDELPNPDVLGSLLPAYLTDLPIDAALSFISGALEHQNEILQNEDATKWFKIHLDEVETIEREANGRVLGKKVRLHFMDKPWKGKGDEKVAQFIDTGWIEYNGWNPNQYAWEIALANTIAEIAESNVGKDLVVQKYVYATDDGNVRMAVNVHEVYNADNDNDDNERKQKSGGKSNKKSPKKQTPSLESIIDDEDPDEELFDEDIEFLHKCFGSEDSDPFDEIETFLSKKSSKILWPEDQDEPDEDDWEGTIRYIITTLKNENDAAAGK